MKDQPIKRESSDTFGRNTLADLELLRRINERNDDQSEEIFALAAIAGAIVCVCGVAGVIAYSLLS